MADTRLTTNRAGVSADTRSYPRLGQPGCADCSISPQWQPAAGTRTSNQSVRRPIDCLRQAQDGRNWRGDAEIAGVGVRHPQIRPAL